MVPPIVAARGALLSVLLLVAASQTSAWVLDVPQRTVVLAAFDAYFLTGSKSSSSESSYGITAYNTTTQRVLWYSPQACSANNGVPSFFEEVQRGVLRYICDPFSDEAVASQTMDAATGHVLSTTFFLGELFWEGGSPIASKQTGLYCLPMFPPSCVFPNGTLLQPTSGPTASTSVSHYFWGSTYVVANWEEIFFFDAFTGDFLSEISEFFHPSGSVASRPESAVAFVEDLVVMTYVAHTYPTRYAVAVVVNITQRAVTAQVTLGGLALKSFGFEAAPGVWRLGEGLVVALPEWQPDNFTVRLWDVPTANSAANEPPGSGPSVAMTATVPLATPHTVTFFDEQGMQCMPIGGGFVSCSVWASSFDAGGEKVVAATSVIDAASHSVVSASSRQPTVYSITNTGPAGDMLVVTGSQSGPFQTTSGGFRAAVPGAAAFHPTTGALLWEGSYRLIGPALAYDAANRCVVLQTTLSIVCVNGTGSF